MTAIKTLLAAIDFSGPSRHAALRAARLARAEGARLLLLHVVQGTSMARLKQIVGHDEAAERSVVDQTRQQLDEWRAELPSTGDTPIEPLLAQGSVPQAIGAQADAVDADIVVVGARGQGFLRRMLLGSTAERMLRRTLRPLLVVRQRPSEAYRRVLVPVDFSAWSAPLLALARRVAPGSHLVLLHAYEVPFQDKLNFAGVDADVVERYRVQTEKTAARKLHALAVSACLKPSDWTPRVVQGDAALSIVVEEQESDCDLIVIGKHGQNAAEELLLGSVTRDVLAESAGDVLVSTASQPG